MRRKRRGENSFDLVIVAGFVICYFLIPNLFGELKNSIFFVLFWFVILPVIIFAFFHSKDSFSLKTKNKFVFMLREDNVKEMSFIEFLIYKYYFKKSKSNASKIISVSENKIFEYIKHGFVSEIVVVLPQYNIGKNQLLNDFYLNSDKVSGYVYIISNKSMPGIFKVGKTKKHISIRLNDLKSTGVPDDFNIEMIIKSSNEDLLEKTIHKTLSSYRVNKRREFFKIEREQIIMIVIDICNKHRLYTYGMIDKPKSSSILLGNNNLKTIEEYISSHSQVKSYL